MSDDPLSVLARLDEIAQFHQMSTDDAGCAECSELWPCCASQLAAAVRVLIMEWIPRAEKLPHYKGEISY